MLVRPNRIAADVRSTGPTYVTLPPRVHGKRTSIQHLQLRDLIWCPESGREFFFAYQNTIKKHNTVTDETQMIQSLDFPPTSICAAGGFVAAGGNRSQLTVKSMGQRRVVYNDRVGGTINNAICIDAVRANVYVSNNDHHIKVFNIDRGAVTNSLPCGDCVNHSAVSADGETLAAVTDGLDLLIFDARHGYQQAARIPQAFTDSGFSCNWSPSSLLLAAASQDGTVGVWDIRSTRRLALLSSRQPSRSGRACRAVKFAPESAIDLLMFSEHVSYVHLVDARHFQDEQVVEMIGPPDCELDISGVAFSPDASKVFVGVTTAVVEFDVATVARRCHESGELM